GLAFAAAVRPFHERVFRHQFNIETQAEVGMQPLFDMFLQPIPPRSVVAYLDLHCHFVAHDSIADGTLGDTQPLARGAVVALDCRQAGWRPDADTADADHRVAATQHFLHAPEAAAAFA